MSDVRARLADALRNHRPSSFDNGASCSCGNWGCGNWRWTYGFGWDDHILDVLLSLDGIAIVELPAADSTRYEGDDVPSTDRLAWFPDGEFSVSRWNYPEVQIEYRGEPLEPVAIRTARALAAALLAAADAAEGGSE